MSNPTVRLRNLLFSVLMYTSKIEYRKLYIPKQNKWPQFSKDWFVKSPHLIFNEIYCFFWIRIFPLSIFLQLFCNTLLQLNNILIYANEKQTTIWHIGSKIEAGKAV